MNFLQYVSRQKEIIKDKHRGEEFLIINGEVIPLRSSDEILNDIINMDGLFDGGQAFCFSREECYEECYA